MTSTQIQALACGGMLQTLTKHHPNMVLPHADMAPHASTVCCCPQTNGASPPDGMFHSTPSEPPLVVGQAPQGLPHIFQQRTLGAPTRTPWTCAGPAWTVTAPPPLHPGRTRLAPGGTPGPLRDPPIRHATTGVDLGWALGGGGQDVQNR